MFGKELILDLINCKGIEEKMLKDYVYELCDLIDIERYGKCHIEWFGKPPFEGYSLFQFVTTSSITGHFTKTKAYINIFSCKDFNIEKIKKFSIHWFEANIKKIHCIRR